MIDPNKILSELGKSGLGSGMAGGLLSGALAGAITGGKSGKGNKLLKLGTLAAVGTVAYKAYQQYQQNQAATTPAPAAAPGTFGNAAWTPPAAAVPSGEAMTLLRAMIAAAKADGQIDAAESQQIMERLQRANFSNDEKAFLLEELARPLNVDAVIAGVRTPQQAAEVYAASRLVIAEASPAEQAYLGLLAARLNLDAAATRELDLAVKALPG
jgi:uncharacterized membrane protein YebE (DUF533 family)